MVAKAGLFCGFWVGTTVVRQNRPIRAPIRHDENGAH